MGWIRKTQPEPEHMCKPPTREVVTDTPRRTGIYLKTEPDGGVSGDLWQCDSCGMVWEITSSDRDGYTGALRWRKAAWFTQRRYRKRRKAEGWLPPRTGGYVPERRGGYPSARVPRDQMKPPPESAMTRKPPPGGGGIARPHVILRSASEIDSTPPND